MKIYYNYFFKKENGVYVYFGILLKIYVATVSNDQLSRDTAKGTLASLRLTCTPIEDSDQTVHPYSLISHQRVAKDSTFLQAEN